MTTLRNRLEEISRRYDELPSNYRNGDVVFVEGPKYKKKEFILTPYLTVKLESDKTIIYVHNEKFNQCKYLLLTIDSQKDWEKQGEINSIDEAAEFLSRDHEHKKVNIPPETEFWGHCSNLQAWVENRYDLRIIHTNLGFPLLKKLALYDPIALISLKEEIASRIETTGYKAFEINRTVIDKFFTEEEKFTLVEESKQTILNRIKEKKYHYKEFIKYKEFLRNFLTKAESFDLMFYVKAVFIELIKKEYKNLDIYTFLKKSCALCERVFSDSGYKCTACIKFNNFQMRKGITIPETRYKELNLSHFSFGKLLNLYRHLTPVEFPDLGGVIEFAGGRSADNDMRELTDFVWTIRNVMEEFRRNKDHQGPIRILTHPDLQIIAQIDNHFDSIAGISEYERIMMMHNIDFWEVSTDVERDVMYFYDSVGNGLRTGRLALE